MRTRTLAAWLALLAISLQAAWPLVATARPRSVTLVPLCTVDGVTHYLELPVRETPPGKSSRTHHDHCSFCFLGQLSAVPCELPIRPSCDARAERAPAARAYSLAQAVFISQDARAPPLPAVRSI